MLNRMSGHCDVLLNLTEELNNGAPQMAVDPDEADSQMDVALDEAAMLPAVPIRTQGTVLEQAAINFARDLEATTAEFRQSIGSLSEEITEMQENYQQHTAQLESRAAEIAEQITQRVAEAEATSSARLDEIKETAGQLLSEVRDSSERLGREVTSIQETFSGSQRERETAFNQSQEQNEAYFHEAVDPLTSEVKELTEEARDMLQEVAGASTAQHYDKHRKRQNMSANIWAYLGFGGLVGLVAAAIWVFWQAGPAEQEFDLPWLVARTGLLGSILLLATFAIRQAGQNRRREEETSRVANELLLLGPFISRLPESDRQILLREITPLYFRGGLPAQGTQADRSKLQSLASRTKAKFRGESEEPVQ